MRKALTPYISTAIIIMLGIVVISLVLTVVSPALNKAQDSVIINEAFQNLNLIDSTIREVVSEGEYAKRTINIKVTEGVYTVDSLGNRMSFNYKLKSDLNVGGQRNKVNITRSMGNLNLFITYNKIDIQGSDRFVKGENSVAILHNGINATTNHPIIYVGK